MKKSSKKLLFYLGPSGIVDPSFSSDALEYVLPELSPEGARSLLYLLNKNYFLEIFNYQKKKQLRITTSGIRQLKSLFPAVFGQDELGEGLWSCVVFIKPPSNDKAFRQLRRLVLADGALVLSRGVYLKPGSLSGELLKTFEEFYRQSISVFTVEKWIFGFDSLKLLKKMGVDEQLNTLSGISNEADQLLDNFLQNKYLHYQRKKQIVSLLDRFYTLALSSGAINQKYLTQEDSISSILQKCQKLLKLL